MALKSAELSRREAAGKMHLISTDLSVKLNKAATDYDRTDHQEGGNLTADAPSLTRIRHTVNNFRMASAKSSSIHSGNSASLACRRTIA